MNPYIDKNIKLRREGNEREGERERVEALFILWWGVGELVR
jgi:hypothetical protein